MNSHAPAVFLAPLTRAQSPILAPDAEPEMLQERGAGEGPAWHPELGLLTSGLVTAGMQSLAAKKRMETPHLNVHYQTPRESTFWQT